MKDIAKDPRNENEVQDHGANGMANYAFDESGIFFLVELFVLTENP